MVYDIQTLIDPKPLKLCLWLCLGSHPFFQRRQHLFFTSLLEHSPRFLPLKTVDRSKLGQELFVAQFGQVGFLRKRATLIGDAPDPAVHVIPAFVAKIDFAVLDDWVRPVRNIQRTIRPHLHIDRPEGNTR